MVENRNKMPSAIVERLCRNGVDWRDFWAEGKGKLDRPTVDEFQSDKIVSEIVAAVVEEQTMVFNCAESRKGIIMVYIEWEFPWFGKPTKLMSSDLLQRNMHTISLPDWLKGQIRSWVEWTSASLAWSPWKKRKPKWFNFMQLLS